MQRILRFVEDEACSRLKRVVCHLEAFRMLLMGLRSALLSVWYIASRFAKRDALRLRCGDRSGSAFEPRPDVAGRHGVQIEA
jgi:hypothetical protein